MPINLFIMPVRETLPISGFSWMVSLNSLGKICLLAKLLSLSTSVVLFVFKYTTLL